MGIISSSLSLSLSLSHTHTHTHTNTPHTHKSDLYLLHNCTHTSELRACMNPVFISKCSHQRFEYLLYPRYTLFQQHKRRLYTWTSPDGQYRNQIDYVLCSQRWRSSIQSAKTSLGADCGSDHGLLIAKFRLKLKKVGKPLGEGNGTPLQYYCLENPMDGGAW